MNNLIEILPNIYGVKMPSDAVDFKKYYNRKNKWYVEYSKIYILNEIPIEFDFKILGTLTKDEISFDASEVVKHKISGKVLGNIKLYWNFKTKKWCFDYEKSFRSALPEEIYFENPFESPNENTITDRDGFKKIENYYKSKENITEKLLILQKL